MEAAISKEECDRISKEIERLLLEVHSHPHVEAKESVVDRLHEVESKIQETYDVMVSNEAFEKTTWLMKEEVKDVTETAAAALANVARVQEELSQNMDHVENMNVQMNSMANEMETMKLALEVVEHSLEDFDESETIESLRSRMDDLDAGIEKNAETSQAKVLELEEKLLEMKERIERTESAATCAATKADTALATADAARAEVTQLRQNIQESSLRFDSLPSSGSSTPRSHSRSSDPRVKAAIHTLSDGYRSLHRAMSLMYDEQTDVAKRVSFVGRECMAPSKALSINEKIHTVNRHSQLSSYPLSDVSVSEDQNQKKENAEPHLSILVASQAADIRRAESRADALENEVAQLKKLLTCLCPDVHFDDTTAMKTQNPGETKVDTSNRDDVKVKISWCNIRKTVLVKFFPVANRSHSWKIGSTVTNN